MISSSYFISTPNVPRRADRPQPLHELAEDDGGRAPDLMLTNLEERNQHVEAAQLPCFHDARFRSQQQR